MMYSSMYLMFLVCAPLFTFTYFIKIKCCEELSAERNGDGMNSPKEISLRDHNVQCE
jgi:hypothetical protein